ncbi:hypothetical protein ACHAWF_014697 [Thalassiosira exigua]
MRSTAIPAALAGLCFAGTLGFAPPPPALLSSSSGGVGGTTTTTTPTTSLLRSTPEPLATEGDWSAYLDAESTGYVYYFNDATGESTWNPPTATFPPVDAAAAAAKTAAAEEEASQEDRRAERQRKREERRREREESGGGGGGFFGGLFGGKKEAEAAEPQKTKAEQLSDLSAMADNDAFLSELDDVIAEAEEAIAIADKMEESPPKNQGGFFSNFGFVSGKEATEEAEALIADAEERTTSIFSQFSFGARASPKALEKKVEPVVEEEGPGDGAEVWVEGLKGLFQRSFEAFIPPQTATTTEKKVVAVDAKPKEKKADVSDSEFLDVVWGAETSARPTLNIAEMMKAFQVQSTDEVATTTATDAEEFRTLSLDVALQVKPHPEKAAWGGEDYGFSVGRTFGIFDGVSGAEKERGKKLYSRSLSESMKKSAGKGGMSVQDMQDRLLEAKDVADAGATGASTAVVASIGEDNVLRAINLGDSVCLVLRDGAVAARTREIVHYFDCPYQLGDDSPDRPKDGTTLQAEVFQGDVIVAGSDGVFDNLSDADVCEIVGEFGTRTKAGAIAKKIMERSRQVSLDPGAVTPYSTVARGRSGYSSYRDGRGGKVDDISCIVVKAS